MRRVEQKGKIAPFAKQEIRKLKVVPNSVRPFSKIYLYYFIIFGQVITNNIHLTACTNDDLNIGQLKLDQTLDKKRQINVSHITQMCKTLLTIEQITAPLRKTQSPCRNVGLKQNSF